MSSLYHTFSGFQRVAMPATAGCNDHGMTLPTIYAYSSPRRPHYPRHIEPVARELKERGHAVELLRPGMTPPAGAVALVASSTDVHALSTIGDRRIIHIEHGAGQTYDGDPSVAGSRGYPGGEGYDRVILFICPSDTVVDKWNARYPGAAAVAVGCPALDEFHANPLPPEKPRIAVTFHWRSGHCPEASTAWEVYSRAVQEQLVPLALKEGWSLVGTEHPRWEGQLLTDWQMMGVPTAGAKGLSGWKDVMQTATLLVADNTSMQAEFASLGRPVLWLNSPEYRRDVNHGGRFWEWPEGQVQCDSPFDLAAKVRDAMADGPAVAAAREAMVSKVYKACDGKASARAADAIEAVLA